MGKELLKGWIRLVGMDHRSGERRAGGQAEQANVRTHIEHGAYRPMDARKAVAVGEEDLGKRDSHPRLVRQDDRSPCASEENRRRQLEGTVAAESDPEPICSDPLFHHFGEPAAGLLEMLRHRASSFAFRQHGLRAYRGTPAEIE